MLKLCAALMAACVVTPSVAADPPPAPHACLSPSAIVQSAREHNDWVIIDGKAEGVLFRDGDRVIAALFDEQGCLSTLVLVGKAAPDLMI